MLAEGNEAHNLLAGSGRRKIRRKIFRVCLRLFFTLSLVMAGLLGAAYWHFQGNDNSDFLRERVLAAVAQAAGPDATITLDRAALGFSTGEPVFSLAGLSVSEPGAGLAVEVDRLDLGLTAGSLVLLSPEPTSLTLSSLRIIIPKHDEGRDAVAIIQRVLGGIAGFTQMIAAVPNLQLVELPQIAILRRQDQGAPLSIGEPMGLRIRRYGEQIRVELDRVASREGAERGTPLGLDLTVRPQAQGAHALAIRSEGNGVAALLALVGYPLKAVDPRLRLDMELDAGVVNGRKEGPVAARIAIGGGTLDLTPYGIPVLQIDELALALSGEPGSTRIDISKVVFRSLETQIVAAGQLDIEGENKRLRLRAENPTIKPLSAGLPVMPFDEAAIEASIARDLSGIVIDRLLVRDGAGEAQASLRFSKHGGGLIETAVSARDLDVFKAIRLWPVFVSPRLREWIIERLRAGRLETLSLRTSLAGQVLEDAWGERPIPDEAIAASYRLTGVELAAVPEAPAIRNAVLAGESSGRKSSLRLEAGTMEAEPSKAVSLAGAQFHVADVYQQPALLEMRIPVLGRLDAVSSVLSSPGLRSGTPIPAEIARGEGLVEGEIQAALKLEVQPRPQDLRVDARASIRNVLIPAIIPGERLDNGQFQLSVKGNSAQLRGEARLNALPVQIEWKSEPGSPQSLVVKGTLDDTQRQRRGLDLRPILTGPVATKVFVTFERGKPPEVSIEGDLTAARVDGFPPGYTKRPGQAAKVSFDYATRGERVILSDLELDLGQVALRGTAEVGKDGTLLKGDFDQFRLSPGDNARASFDRQRGLHRLTVRGNSFDLRPFLRGVQSGRIDQTKTPDIDLDIQATVLVGFSSELIAGGEVLAQRRGGALSRLQVSGRFGPSPVTVETVETTSREGLLLRIGTADGGALLRFLDIYSKARGGRMTADIRLGRDGQSGIVQMRDFEVRGEPLLARYASDPNVARTPSQGRGQVQTGSRDSVLFTKMRADFARRPGRIDLREAVMWGDQVGGTLEGVLDYGNDRVDMKGALVPAYALNNLFAQVPILGPIFGGAQYEGLFALPFVIQGKASAPLLRTNTLSVIAPGFLRKLFEVQREGGEANR